MMHITIKTNSERTSLKSVQRKQDGKQFEREETPNSPKNSRDSCTFNCEETNNIV